MDDRRRLAFLPCSMVGRSVGDAGGDDMRILIDNKIDDHSHFDEGPQISIPTADCESSLNPRRPCA